MFFFFHLLFLYFPFVFLLKKCFFLFHFVSLFSFLGCSKSVAALQDSLGKSAHSELALFALYWFVVTFPCGIVHTLVMIRLRVVHGGRRVGQVLPSYQNRQISALDETADAPQLVSSLFSLLSSLFSLLSSLFSLLSSLFSLFSLLSFSLLSSSSSLLFSIAVHCSITISLPQNQFPRSSLAGGPPFFLRNRPRKKGSRLWLTRRLP